MALYFDSSNPAQLLKLFEDAVALGGKKGGISTWVKHSSGNFFAHIGDQFEKCAWFQPKVETSRLALYLIITEGKKYDSMAYAYYHGHLIETMIHHFDSAFTLASATPQGVVGDSFKKS